MSNESLIQLIFVVETNKNANTDVIYINEVLKKYYKIGENKISYVYLKGKHNYNNIKTINTIEKYISDYKKLTEGNSHVIYFLDKDKSHLSFVDATFIENVEKFCHTNNYLLVWFVETIENVMWGAKIKDNMKKVKSLEFARKRQIDNVNLSNLRATNNVNQNGKSNIITILNEFHEIQ